MIWYEVRVFIHNEAEEAIGERLLTLGAEGVAVEDPMIMLEAKKNNWGDYLPEEVPEDDMVTVSAYFKDPIDLKVLREGILEFESFGLKIGSFCLSHREVKEEDWAHAWKQYYKGERVGKLLILPSWEKKEETEDLVLYLDPGMAFGTGNHPTTKLSLELMQTLDLKDKRVIDVGTGSGILALSSILLGSKNVQALDVDKGAIEVARNNAYLNAMDLTIFHGTLEDLEGKAEVILANIIPDVILPLFPLVKEKLLEGGYFITSGIILQKEEEVAKKAREHGFSLVARRNEGEWVAFCYRQGNEEGAFGWDDSLFGKRHS